MATSWSQTFGFLLPRFHATVVHRYFNQEPVVLRAEDWEITVNFICEIAKSRIHQICRTKTYSFRLGEVSFIYGDTRAPTIVVGSENLVGWLCANVTGACRFHGVHHKIRHGSFNKQTVDITFSSQRDAALYMMVFHADRIYS